MSGREQRRARSVPNGHKERHMNSNIAERDRVGRRSFLQIAAAGLGAAAGANGTAMAGPSEQAPDVASQPTPVNFGDDLNTADIIVETLISWGATHAFGIVGDGINSIIEALRKRRDRIQYIA
jgi:pyruvate dehydrogenase (quinone)